MSPTERALAFLAIAAMFLLFFGRLLDASFYVVEDHFVFKRNPSILLDWLTRVSDDWRVYGRVRPGYWLYIVGSFAAWGNHPGIWHAAGLLWGTLTCFLLYLTLRRMGAGISSSVMFVLLLVLSGTQNWIWINFTPAETPGMLMTSVAVWAAVMAATRPGAVAWQVIALGAIALAGTAKESFVLLLPALLLLSVTCGMAFGSLTLRESMSGLRVLVWGGTLAFLIQLGVIASSLLLMPVAYGANAAGVSAETFDPRRWLSLLSPLPTGMRWVFAIVPVAWAAMWFERKQSRAVLLTGIAVFAAWIVPQLVLYKNGIQERYLFPMIVGVAAAIALALSAALRTRRLRLIWLAGIAGLVPVLVRGVAATTVIIGAFVAETKASNRMVTFVAQNVGAQETILMAGDAGTAYGFEATYSLPMYLKLAGSNSPFYLWPLVSQGERSAMHVAASHNNTAFKYPDSLSPSDVGAIIIVDKWIPGFDYGPLHAWLGDTSWRELSFTEPYESFQPRALGYRKAGEVTHRILLATAARGAPGGNPLVVIDRSLAGAVAVEQFEPPPWGLERDEASHGSIAWIGRGESEGLGGTLSTTRTQRVELEIDVVPGPARPGSSRTVEVSADSRTGTQTERAVFEGGQWTFRLTLEPGPNHFRIRILDEATVAVQPNGDTRRLMALVRHLTVRRASTD